MVEWFNRSAFALTDPGERISRTRLFPRVTRVISMLAPKFE
jgi:hypothetical protein